MSFSNPALHFLKLLKTIKPKHKTQHSLLKTSLNPLIFVYFRSETPRPTVKTPPSHETQIQRHGRWLQGRGGHVRQLRREGGPPDGVGQDPPQRVGVRVPAGLQPGPETRQQESAVVPPVVTEHLAQEQAEDEQILYGRVRGQREVPGVLDTVEFAR